MGGKFCKLLAIVHGILLIREILLKGKIYEEVTFSDRSAHSLCTALFHVLLGNRLGRGGWARHVVG